MAVATITAEEYRAAATRAATSGRTMSEELGLAPAPRTVAVPGAGAPAAPRPAAWSAAVPRMCPAGHRHASKLEARVCRLLTEECARAGATLFQQVRLPLLSSAPVARGRALYATVDFAVWHRGKLVRLADAKGRVSREWARGAAALHSTCAVPVEEITNEVATRMEAAELLGRAVQAGAPAGGEDHGPTGTHRPEPDPGSAGG